MILLLKDKDAKLPTSIRQFGVFALQSTTTCCCSDDSNNVSHRDLSTFDHLEQRPTFALHGGAQTGPLMSLAAYRRFLLPHQVRMADLARSYGVHVMYHTDGAARVFLRDLVDRVGIEILNPIQWRCAGMEREGLVRDFGERIIFHGSIDNQRTLPFGTADDVVDEVRESVEIYRDARWICAPCHNLQAVTPVENIVAMYDEAWRYGRR